MKHGYSKNGAVSVPDTFWVLVLWGTSVCMRTPSVPKFFKKKKNHFLSFFSFGYVTKINKSNKSSET